MGGSFDGRAGEVGVGKERARRSTSFFCLDKILKVGKNPSSYGVR